MSVDASETYLTEHSHFDPDTVAILAIALQQAWESIEKSGNRLARAGYARAAREIVARHIIDLALNGERDPDRLRDKAIAYLEGTYKFSS
jgi:hypothetical protein